MPGRRAHSQKVTLIIQRADPDGTWVIEAKWQADGHQSRSIIKQIDGSADFDLDDVAAWQLRDVIVGAVQSRLF